MKIFLCSTSFDLEDLRALAVDRFGKKHEFIHFEDAAFPSRRGLHSHDQCIEAVKLADVIVCIIDKRYGGHYRGTNDANFPEQLVKFKATVGKKEKTVEVKIATKDLSISWCELLTAFQDEKYVITFARKRTLDEKETRRKNQGIAKFRAAHVDDIRVFDLLDWITKQRKDNWIIPFHNAVDFLKKMEKWLNVADGSLVLPVTRAAAPQKPITILVEGRTDAEIVRAIVRRLLPNRRLNLVATGGKRSLLGNLKVYSHAYKDSAGIIVLADADTDDVGEIGYQKAQFKKIIKDSKPSITRLNLAVPNIEAWLEPNDLRCIRTHNYKRLFEGQNLEERAIGIPSLADFIVSLKSIDALSLKDK